MQDVQELIYKMLMENTGVHLLDSGGAYGRNWERNQGKTLEEFRKEDSVKLELKTYSVETRKYGPVKNTKDIEYTISVFHYLKNQLELDPLCDEFNSIPVDDWDSENGSLYGVSKRGEAWLDSHGFEIGGSFNTYNGEDFLSQVLQGAYLTSPTGAHYVLLQVHGGCDVRGGYTDAKMFKTDEDSQGYLWPQDVYGKIVKNGENVPFSNCYDGCYLTDDEGKGVEIKPGEIDTISAWVPEEY